MKIINHYTQKKRKIAYTPLIRSFLLFNSNISTFLIKLRRKKFIKPRIRKAFIETISFCNNDCIFCPASTKAGKKNPKEKMTEEIFKKIIAQLHEINFDGILALYCNNEPLLDSRIPNFIKRLKVEFPANKIEIITNGTLLTAPLAEELFDSGLSTLLINHYDNTLKLSEDLNKFVEDFANSPYHKKVSIYLRLKDEVLSNRLGNAGNAENFDKSLPLWCSLPFEQLYLNYAGDVILCCSDVLWETVLGNINENPLGEIWYNNQFFKIRKALLEGRRNKIETCKRCDFIGIRHNPKAFLSTMALVFGLRKP